MDRGDEIERLEPIALNRPDENLCLVGGQGPDLVAGHPRWFGQPGGIPHDHALAFGLA
jgi:hypothetical protein